LNGRTETEFKGKCGIIKFKEGRKNRKTFVGKEVYFT
jgi:hypothetical protein